MWIRLSAGSGLASPAALAATELTAVGCIKSHPPLRCGHRRHPRHPRTTQSQSRPSPCRHPLPPERPASTVPPDVGRRRDTAPPNCPHEGAGLPGSLTTMATDGIGDRGGCGVRLNLLPFTIDKERCRRSRPGRGLRPPVGNCMLGLAGPLLRIP